VSFSHGRPSKTSFKNNQSFELYLITMYLDVEAYRDVMQKQLADEQLPLNVATQQRDLLAGSSSWIWLGIAAALLLFSNGATTIPLAAWLAPVFILRFTRGQSLKVGLPLAYVLEVGAFSLQFRGMVLIPGIGYYLFLILWGISLVLPYAVDRLIAHKLSGLTASLVFPTAWAVTEYAASYGPYGSWGSIAYSQYGNLPLLQILSVTGLWGITFLIGWFAAVSNLLWQDGLESARARRGAWLCFGTIAMVMLLGGARLAFFPPSSPTVRVASISARPVTPLPSAELSGRIWQGNATNTDRDAFRVWAAATDNDLLARAEQEMQAGARIVFWAEINAEVLKEDEPELITRGGNLAAKYQAYLGMALAVHNEGGTPSVENKLVLIKPDGQVAWEYNKVRPVPGDQQILGDGKLLVLKTPYGRISSIICFDGDFPQVPAQAGALNADILLDPSNDWLAIDPWHTQMANFRAIEQGVNLIRQTSRGLSATFDYQGRRLAAMDHFHTADYAMVSEVPTRGVRTVYSLLGDWFAWVCLAALAVFTVLALRRRDGHTRLKA
jgi:apolipoprotein N-acyltransferase